MTDNALLLVNLGSTPSSDVADVRRYLNQFLMDRYVVDVPWPLRRLIVSMILRKRPALSAAAYRSIWWDEGSPLLVISRRLQAKVAEQWNGPVGLTMRYGEPSIENALLDLARNGAKHVTVFPLYPQFADSTVTTALEEIRRVVKRHHLEVSFDQIPAFFAQPMYVSTLAQSMEPALKRGFDHLLLSYHGLPERHIHKTDPTRHHCLGSADCCQRASGAVLENCYRAQCVKTSEQVTAALGLSHERWSMSFQSRLGRTKWIEPYTDVVIEQLAARGVKKLAVACPAFVADCIETLEEIGIRGRKQFRDAGGEDLILIPCLNDQPEWVDALVGLCRHGPKQALDV